MSGDEVKITRLGYLAEKIVIVDGLPGCGKTMLSPIIAALERAELLTYTYEIEYICALYFLKKVTADAALNLVRLFTDERIYHAMMSRETNFRPSDLSSVFRDARSLRYIKRLFQEGDKAIPERIKRERPILHLATHNLLAFSEPVFLGLDNRVVFVEVVRHPLYMVKQQAINMESLIYDPRDLTIYFEYKDKQLPYYVRGWEELFISSNQIEKSIYFIERLTSLKDRVKAQLEDNYNARIITIPFESFVVEPWPYLKKLEVMLETKVTSVTRRAMKRQNVPRKMYAEGIGLNVYKRYGWHPPKSGASENSELESRRNFVLQYASPDAMATLDRLCNDYETKYMNGVKRTGEHYE